MRNTVNVIKPKSLREKCKYETFNFCICPCCIYFKIKKHGCICRLFESVGEYNGVLAQAVCDGFLSCNGTDINNKKITDFPPFVKKIAIGNTFYLKAFNPKKFARGQMII